MDGFSEMLRSCYAACAEKSDLYNEDYAYVVPGDGCGDGRDTSRCD